MIGLLEDGETYSTILKQKQKPGEGVVGQWEHELVCHRYEKPLVLQICRLIRGFTHPSTYFSTESETGGEIALYSVEKFAMEMDSLLALTLSSNILEKLSIALYDCLFNDELLFTDDEETQLQDYDQKESKFDIDSKNNINNYNGPRLLDETDHMAITCVHTYLQVIYNILC